MDDLLDALNYIDCAGTSYDEWLSIGMALKEEGYNVGDWINWSLTDASRFNEKTCRDKWNSFTGSSHPVKGGSIVHMAKQRGYKPSYSDNLCMDWNDVIEYDGDGPTYQVKEKRSPADQLILYLETLFESDDLVGYVTGDVYFDSEGYKPLHGNYDRTAKELIDAIGKHKDDLGAVLGDWKKNTGAWIRFNPLDGKGTSDRNVTRFTYALVESDVLSLGEQDTLLRKLELPIACLVYSGGKSLHAIVHIDAKDDAEYRQRVAFLFDYLNKNGLKVDHANKNPSRLSRMPGIPRGDSFQTLIDVNIGKANWNEWKMHIDGIDDSLPPFTHPVKMIEDRPALAPELIKGS